MTRNLEILLRYAGFLGGVWPFLLAAVAAPLLLRALVLRLDRTWQRRAARATGGILALALLAGLVLALQRASMVDDAFISFRYARNLVEGQGLVWNAGERVEGYTNFLWTVCLAAIFALTRIDMPWIALVLSLAAFVANVLVTARLGRLLAGPDRSLPYLPLAACLVAVQLTFCSYATSGLETMAGSLFVNLGALALFRADGPRGAARAGAWLILATFVRPDHGLFYAVAGATLLLEQRPWSAPRLRLLAAFAAPALAYAVYLGWKLTYYGHVLPNTFYAKSADRTYHAQGFRYALLFYLGSHLWTVLPVFAAWIVSRSGSEPARRFKAFAVGSVVVFHVYVIRVGGDFMLGRFFVPLIPLLLLGVEAWIQARLPKTAPELLAGSPLRPAEGRPPWLVAGLLLATCHGGSLITPRAIEWRVADERTFYPVIWRYPMAVDNSLYDAGILLGRVLHERGIEATLSTTGIGMVGYYSRLPLIDAMGLTDATVARAQVSRRGRPGHEKTATPEYLRHRGVELIREGTVEIVPREAVRVARVRGVPGRPWLLFRYERGFVARLRETAPELHVSDFEDYLDRYIRKLRRRRPVDVAKDLEWFRRYYFDHNDDPERLAAIAARARGAATPSRRPR